MWIERGVRRLVVGAVCAAVVTVALPAAALAVALPAPDRPAPGPSPAAAAQAVLAARRVTATWAAHGRPTALVVVRPTTVDLVDHGHLAARVPRPPGVLRLTALAGALPPGWLSISAGTASLSAAVVLTPGVTLDVGDGVTTLRLAGGPTPSDAAGITTGAGALNLHGVTVTSFDRGLGAAMRQAAPGRPSIVVSPDGRLTATDTTFSGLGPARTDQQDDPAISFRAGSTGALVRTSVLDAGGTGVRLDHSRAVHLDGVVVRGAAGDGLVLRDDAGTTMNAVQAADNAGYGVRVTATNPDHPITGITATGNGIFGVGVVRLTRARLTGVTTAGNTGGGLEVSQSSDLTVTGLTATDEPVGVFTHVDSGNLTFDRLGVVRGHTGLQIEKTTTHLRVQAATFQQSSITAVSADGKDVVLDGVAVRDARSALRVERGAAGVTATGLTISGGDDGVIATPGTSGVVLTDLRADGLTGTAVRSASPDVRIVGGVVTGGSTGLDLGAPTTISGTSISGTDQGIRAQVPGLVTADGITVNAAAVGIDAQGTTAFRLTASHVHALEAVRGALDAQGADNDLTLPPLNLLGAIGIPLVLLALGLQGVAALRQRRFEAVRRVPPPVVTRPAGVGVPHPAALAVDAAEPAVTGPLYRLAT